MLNNLILVGRVADEPKQFTTENGFKVSNFVLAVNKIKKDSENDADFIPIRAWFSLADVVKEYVHKGATVGVKAHLATRLNDVNGVKLRVLEVIAEQVIFISSKQNTKVAKDEEKFDDLIVDDCSDDEEEVSE